MVGDRAWSLSAPIEELLVEAERYFRRLVVVSAGWAGPDSRVLALAREHGIARREIAIPRRSLEVLGAGRAGFAHQRRAVELGRPNLVVAFHDFINASSSRKLLVNARHIGAAR